VIKGGYEKISELFRLKDEYGIKYMVLPTFPCAHYLTNSKNPFQIDSAFNVEYQYQDSVLIDKINNKDMIITIFIEKDETAGLIPFLIEKRP